MERTSALSELPQAAAGPRPAATTSGRVAAAALLFALTALAYFPALHAGYVWDDDVYVRQNRTLQSLDGLRQIWLDPTRTPQYYPLVFTTFWVEYHLWGLAPFGYHLTNIYLHAVNAILVWLILRRLAGPGAFVAALVFAVHPIHVESVAWISERKNVLSGMFALLAVLQWLGFVETGRRRGYALALLFFGCALLSKTTVIALPVVLPLLAWWKGRTYRWRGIPLLVPFLTFSVGFALVTAWRENLEAQAGSGLSLAGRILVAGRALWFYAGKVVWPVHLMTMYPQWQIDTTAAWQYLFPLAAITVPLMLWRARRRFGAGPFIAIGAFEVMLAPALGLRDFHFMRFSYVADHFAYLPSIAIIALFAAVAARAARGQRDRALVMLAGSIAVMALSALTWSRSGKYLNEGTLWRDNLAQNPSAWGAHAYLGVFLAKQGALDEAVQHLTEAVRLRPTDAFAQSTLGTTLVGQGKLDRGIAHLREALRLNSNDADMHYNLATALFRRGVVDEAARHFAAAIRARPDFATAHNNLGVILFQQGDVEAALQEFAAAVRIAPDYAEAHNDFGMALLRAGDAAAATEHFRTALRLKPDYAEAQENLTRALAPHVRD